jgi:hypothetical protein
LRQVLRKAMKVGERNAKRSETPSFCLLFLGGAEKVRRRQGARPLDLALDEQKKSFGLPAGTGEHKIEVRKRRPRALCPGLKSET